MFAPVSHCTVLMEAVSYNRKSASDYTSGTWNSGQKDAHSLKGLALGLICGQPNNEMVPPAAEES